ncbi:MAG: hypothetical protein ACRD6I_14355, partial [Candidatus Acidiferrales bacterium]
KTALLVGGGLLAVALVVAAASTGVFRSSEPVTLPQGTTISVRLDHGIATDTHESGDEFEATVAAAVAVGGKEVIAAGAAARGHIAEARESGRLQTPAKLVLALKEVEVDGVWYDIDTALTGRRGKSHKKRNWLFIGGGAAGGALIGGLAGGGKGAAIGAGVGAGAGTAGAAATGKQEIRLPAETQLAFRLTDAVTVDVATDRANSDKDD